jgi:ribokinase
MQEACGGKGFNQALALCRAGFDTCFAGAIGRDGDALAAELESAGVDTTHLLRRTGPTGHAVIQLDKEGHNCIIVCSGANGTVTADEVEATLDAFGPGDLLVVQNEMSETDYAIRTAHRRGMLVAANPSPFDERIQAWDIDCIDYLFVNEVEGALLSGTSDVEGMLAEFRSRYPETCIVLTLGEQGSRCLGTDGVVRAADAMPVDVVDTTAAGDTFTGYFLAEVLRGNDLDQALRAATVASGLAVTRAGAGPSIPHMSEVAALLDSVSH